MRWFQNLKLYVKLLISFGLLIFLLLFISFFCSTSIARLDTNYSYLLADPSNRETILEQTMIDYMDLRRMVTKIALQQYNADELAALKDTMDTALNKVIDDVGQYQTSLQADTKQSADQVAPLMDMSNEVKNLLDGDSGYRSVYLNIISSVGNNQYDQAVTLLDNCAAIADKVSSDISSMIQMNTNTVNSTSDSLTLNARSTQNIASILSVTAIILGSALALYIAISLSRRIATVIKASHRLSEGIMDERLQNAETDEIGVLASGISDVQNTVQNIINDFQQMFERHSVGEIDYFTDSTQYKGSYAVLVDNVNYMIKSQIDMSKTALKCVGEIGEGNFSASIQAYPGKKAFINTAIEELRGNIMNVSREINTLIEASIDGRLSIRADAGKFKGGWRTLTDSLNKLCDTIVNPVMESLRVLKEIAKGHLNAKVTGDYKGDFKEMKDAFNFTTGELSKYIGEISRVLQQIAEANLDVAIEGDFLGDFSAVKTSILAVNDRLNDMVGEISEIAEQVSVGAKNIAESGLQLANGASEQAGSVQELSATVESVSQKTRANSESAESASKMSENSKIGALESNRKMKNMLVAMEGIKDSSSQISSIIKTIEDIAFQTNLLALNAAVEAARAGDHGKGFSIVAEEVRGLASRSQAAAKETTVLIEDSINRVNDGTALALSAAESLDVIVRHVSDISGFISQISGSSKEQAEAVSEINIGLSQIANVATANAATSEESSAASEELSSHVESLYKLISMFTLKKSAHQIGYTVRVG